MNSDMRIFLQCRSCAYYMPDDEDYLSDRGHCILIKQVVKALWTGCKYNAEYPVHIS